MKTFVEISAEVLPWAREARPLEPPHADDPDYQAAYALWAVILRPGRQVTARLAALREYYDRTRGRPTTGDGSPGDGLAELDLGQLTPDETVELVRLLKKARPTGEEGEGGG